MTDSRLLNVVGRHDRLTLTGLYPGWAIGPVFTSAWRYQATSYCQYKLGVYEHNIWESCSTAINGTPLHNTNLWQKTIELTEAFFSPTKTRLQPLRPFFKGFYDRCLFPGRFNRVMNLITWPPSLADCWLKPPWKPHVNEGLCDALNAISSVWSHYGGFHSQLAAPQSSLDIRRETTARQTYGKYGFCDVCSCSDGGKKKDRFIKGQFISGVLKVSLTFLF